MRYLAARQGPASVWIELTSKCPLRCVFCSRENLRGEGEHMDFGMFESLLNALDDPEILRLNYSGESANYPRLIEAIAKAKALTGAQTEMVTSLVSMPMETLLKLPGSGIDRISISLHTLEKSKFPMLYGGGSLEGFERRLDALMRASRLETRPPVIDMATVAVQSNVNELAAVSSVAAACGATSLSVHPVIRRPGVPELFHIEVQPGGRMVEDFERELEASIARASDINPGVRISVARPPNCAVPRGSFTCEQNPFETTHVLADGDVVACEVMDRIPLGNLRQTGFREIWQGPAYADLRSRYDRDEVPECTACIFRAAVTEIGVVRTLWGWHDRDGSNALWSRTACSFECEGKREGMLILTGMLPPGPGHNNVEILRDGERVGIARNESEQPRELRIVIAVDSSQETNRFIARTEHGFSPWRRGEGNDTRELGFALFGAHFGAATPTSLEPAAKASKAWNSAMKRKVAENLLRALKPLEAVAPGGILSRGRPRGVPADSLGVIIPERGNPGMLADCLAALKQALASVTIPSEVIVVVNGSVASEYDALKAAYPRYRFAFVQRPLGFTAAIQKGLGRLTTGWTYLLNSDMLLEKDALAAILLHRSTTVFSLASKISMTSERSEKETNRTGIELVNGLANLVELDGNSGGPVEHFYSGGGSSLFQAEWLRFIIGNTTCYDPFYWEDVEWGVRARSMGLKNLFVPDSRARHEGKVTVRRFYEPSEVFRIFERNRIQFQLRCMPDGDMTPVVERLRHAPWRTAYELLQPSRMVSTAGTRAALRRLRTQAAAVTIHD
jgi:MoaA/NifB/PqqE/SkfB family radical SAM enzyme/GT2 family glycosyltransferase